MYIPVSLAYSYRCTLASSYPPICAYKATDTSVGACVGLYTCVCVAVSICVSLCVHMSVCMCEHAPGSICLQCEGVCTYLWLCQGDAYPCTWTPGNGSVPAVSWVGAQLLCTEMSPWGVHSWGLQDEVGSSSPRSHAVHPRCHSHRSVSSWLRKEYQMFIEGKSMPDEYHKWKLLPGRILSPFQRTWHSGVMTSSCLPGEGQKKSDYKMILLLFSSVNGSSLFHYRLYCEVRLHKHLFAFII